MATGKENTPIHIALIVFVLLTIVLSVTSFMFYKEFEESETNRVASEGKSLKSDIAIKEKDDQLGQLMKLVGETSSGGTATADQVETIMGKFQRDQQEFAETYEGSDAKIYPAIFKYQRDQFVKLQGDVEDLRQQITKIKSGHVQELAAANKKTEEVTTAFKAKAAEIRDVEEKYAAKHKDLTKQLAAFQGQITEGQKELLDSRDKHKKRENELVEQVTKKSDELVVVTHVVKSFKEEPGAAPDGLVVGINQAKGSVYINLGFADGLRKQTVFRVYPYDAINIKNAVPKGAIEIVKIVNAHLSIARVTEDQLTDPIVRDDKIYSIVFRPGRREGFALAGLIDIDGDDRSDLTQLRSLIRTNQGAVDVYVDEQGKQHGSMSPSTKYLVIGQRPTENTDPKLMKSYDRLVDDATKFGVTTISLSDFLDYMGYQGRERSIGLGTRANSSEFKNRASRRAGSSAFRRRTLSDR